MGLSVVIQDITKSYIKSYINMLPCTSSENQYLVYPPKITVIYSYISRLHHGTYFQYKNTKTIIFNEANQIYPPIMEGTQLTDVFLSMVKQKI